jgi:ubiquinone/menaquinone biosynthesis C-methylase UbiE
VDLLKFIFEKYKISKKSKILDASCGTLDVAYMVKNLGYADIIGVDGSLDMISAAPDTHLKEIHYEVCRWEEIDKYFHISIFCIYIYFRSFYSSS